MDAYRDQYATLFRGGKQVTLLAISVDPLETLASWAHDADYPFTFLSDSGGVVGKLYGAFSEKNQLDNRTLYVVSPGGTISYVASPFREIDPQSYTALGAAVEEAAGPKP